MVYHLSGHELDRNGKRYADDIQRKNALKWAKEFAKIAHEHGYQAMLQVECQWSAAGRGAANNVDGIKRCVDKIQVPAAKHYDLTALLLMKLQDKPDDYEKAVSYAARKIKLENPDIKIIPLVTSTQNIKSKKATPNQIYNSLDRVADIIDGFQLTNNVSDGHHGGDALQGPVSLKFLKLASRDNRLTRILSKTIPFCEAKAKTVSTEKSSQPLIQWTASENTEFVTITRNGKLKMDGDKPKRFYSSEGKYKYGPRTGDSEFVVKAYSYSGRYRSCRADINLTP